jgi:release factor glutamine methyltransferase
MQILIAHHLKCTRMELYMRFDESLDENILVPLRVDLKKRGERIPLQYLIGSVYFHNHDFKSDARALIPRPETEELVALLIKEHPTPPATVLDLGCGSGVIGLSLALAWPSSRITLVDVSPDALALTQENLTALSATNATLLHSDLFSALQGKTFDLIVANLPYVPENDRPTLTPEVLYDPSLALFSGSDGMDLLRTFCQTAPHFLNPGGTIAMEIGIHQDTQVAELLAAAGLHHIRVQPDLSGIPRFPLAKSLP